MLYNYNGNVIEEKPKTTSAIIGLVLLLFMLSALCIVGLISKRKPDVQAFSGTIWTAGSTTITQTPNFDRVRPFRITSSQTFDDFKEALRLWHAKVGPFADPELYSGGDCGDRNALACADPDKNRITVMSSFHADMKSVYMHEIGHILGVPHIEGDAIMNAWNAETAPEPTEIDVAVAKVTMKRRKK